MAAQVTNAQLMGAIVELTKAVSALVEAQQPKAAKAPASKPKASKVSEPVKAVNPYARVGCAYGTCKGRFLPHGVGSRQHTSCKRGRAALKAAK